MIALMDDGPRNAPVRLVLAHGAGAPMSSPFMTEMAFLLASHGILVTRFEFAYMARRRRDGVKQPPPKIDVLVTEYNALIAAIAAKTSQRQRLAIGGKSMGGRAASMAVPALFEQGLISALVCLGYPFHPQGKPEKLRTAHLSAVRCPALIVQGERDPFGCRSEVQGYALQQPISVAWLPDGDHDFRPPAASPITYAANMAAAAGHIARFLSDVGPGQKC